MEKVHPQSLGLKPELTIFNLHVCRTGIIWLVGGLEHVYFPIGGEVHHPIDEVHHVFRGIPGSSTNQMPGACTERSPRRKPGVY